MVILSPGYLASEWCQRERNLFLRKVGEWSRPSSRIFIVERYKIEEGERPEEFRDLLGYRFWIMESEGRSPRILGEPKPNPNDPKSQLYYNQINDLSFDLAKELKRLKSIAENPVTEVSLDTRVAVFLAEVTDDLIIQRDELKRYLNQAGFRVIPEAPLYFNEPVAFQKSVDRNLGESKIFVQLLSGLSGRRIPGQLSYPFIQYQRALEAKKRILQWRSPSLDIRTITDKYHRSLLEGETVLAVSIGEFKRRVVENVKTKPITRTGRMYSLVFLNVNPEDSLLAQEIISVIKKYDIGYILPLQEGKASDVRKDLEKCLIDSDGVMVIYGSVTPVWAREQLLYCRKIMYKREQPMKAVAVYEGPPEEKKSLNIELPDMYTINCRRCLVERELQPFLESIKTGC